MAGYTVIDFETTGLSPRHGDRIVEIGVVKVSHQGEVYDAWGTLVNPRRDVGASNIHGITARDVAKAPTFDEVAPALLDAIDGRIIAAHNAGFDTRFLSAELRRAGYPVADVPVPAVCTMEWSGAFLRSPSRRVTPAAIQIKGTDGPDWVAACVLLDVRATLRAEARMGYGTCERCSGPTTAG